MKNKLTALPKPVKVLLWVLLALFAYALPLLEPPIISTPGVDFGGVLFTVSIYCLVALGLNIVVGYAGLLDLGYVGFYAIGAYTVAILTSFHASWPLLLAIPVGVVAAMVSGVILGAPTLRVRGDYLAIVTLGFGEIIRLVAVNTEWLGDTRGIKNIAKPPGVGGEEGLFQIPHLFWGDGTVLLDTDDKTKFLFFGVLDQIPYYWMGLTAVIIVLIADILIKNSRVGRAWEATREDEDAAELMGVPTFKFKLLAFATGAFVGGLAGGLYASRQGFINPQSFLLLFSILYLASVVVGGQGNRWGVLVGATLVAYLPQRFREFDDFRVLVFGLALVVLAAVRPQGLLPPRRTVRAKKLEHDLEELEEGTGEEEAAHA
ncbi:branched-chain amino acid ABC transporter permease [Nocardioides daeguensis]|uniref:Branched-chain amino acid ABC transporter permease n=1 Tax=Nocardioides daeguensis TaxID=908359 RepID=A0ABP6UTC4_9ACTN|nr:branched-chain amino acid ABC transporter permease [Nocardioides daeguensis]MBV6725640.1 branched-chain amino acid ABC transporter permease [Nocardioides daeguensis]MCR1772845.1 branched-chain amino acid ABC transporter permease [Nocardioides daeguensis]